jgi:Holliday junction resolvase
MTAYRRGYLVELKALCELKKRGYFPFRTAKSGGPFDIGGIRGHEILLLQVKREKKPSSNPIKKYAKDIERLRGLPVPDCVRKEMWIWVDRKGWKRVVVKL